MSARLRPTAEVPRLALRVGEAAASLGVSPDFFAELAPEIGCVRRGSVKLYPVSELQRWLDREASRLADDLRAVAP